MTTKSRRCTVGWTVETTGVRCAVVSLGDSRVLSVGEADFPRPATQKLPGRRHPLEPGSYLRHPREFFPALKQSLAMALRKARIGVDDVEGAGIACDASWIIPVRKDGSPVADLAWGKTVPQAWTQPPNHRPPYGEAKRMTVLGRRIDDPFFEPIVDSLSSRTYWPRVWQMIAESPTLAKKAEYLLELGDWLTWTLTGTPVCGLQASSSRVGGFLSGPSSPSPELLDECDPTLISILDRLRKLNPAVLPPWRPAGTLSETFARKVGLPPGLPIAAPAVSTLAALVGSGVATEPGQLLMQWGDSTAHTVVTRHPQPMAGIVGMAENAVLPETWSFEAFQLGVREMLDWYSDHFQPKRGNSHRRGPNAAVVKRAERLKPGETGLVTMDWWTGNESLLRDHELTGVLIGLRADSGFEAVYRSFLEAAAFGAYTILRGFDTHGILIRRVVVDGDILDECPLLGSILADVTGRELYGTAVPYPAAVGAALYAGAALESEEAAAGALLRAAQSIPVPRSPSFRVHAKNHAIYERLYDQYLILHDFLGRRSSQLMHDLARLRTLARKA